MISGKQMDGKYIEQVILKKDPPETEYFSQLPVVKSLSRSGKLSFFKDVTFFVGENGTGKSTLLEAIAIASGFNAEGGTRNFTFSTRKTHSALHEYLTLVRTRYAKDGFFLRAESLYNLASNIEDLDQDAASAPRLVDSYGGVSLHCQSHGESFLSLVHNRFGGDGLYLLDEPEAALSPARQMALLVEIDRLVHRNSQLIIATHSPILMAYPGAAVYEFSQEGINEVDFRETEHYCLTRRFLNAPEKMLHLLLDDDQRDEN